MPRVRFILAFFFVALVANPAWGDWPSARHDPQRTGVSASVSDIVNPAVYWKAYVGGTLAGTAFLVADINGDGAAELVYVSGGSVVATSGAGKILWQTPPHDIQALFAIDDFDGDGLPDILAAGTSQAFLLAGQTGSFEWSESPSDLGTLGSLRVADFNGDGRPDIVAEECHCCEVNNGASGLAYTFSKSGGSIVGTRLWSLPPEMGDYSSCGVATVLFDLTGSGSVALAHEGQQHVWVIGNDGTVLVNDQNSPALGVAIYNGDCLPANVDGVPGDELVCFQETVYAVQPTPRQVYVLKYNASPPSLTVLWQNTTLADATASGGLLFQPDAVVDLDKNGTLEVVVSGETASVWTTYILDAKSGATLATIAAARTAGTAPLRSDGKVNVLTTDGQNMTAWTFDPTQSPPIQSSWTESNRSTISRVDSSLLRTLRANTALVTPDLNQDGLADVLTAQVSAGSALFGYSAPLGSAAQVATYPFPSNVSPVGTWTVPAVTEKYAQVATVGSDGVLRLFNDSLSADETIQVGGYCGGGLHNSPVLSSLGGPGPQSVFVNDSTGALINFNAQGASLAGSPKRAWSVVDCANPSVIPSLDGAKPGIVCHSARPAAVAMSSVSALRADGSDIWNAILPAKAANDALAGSAQDGGAPTVFVQTIDTASNATTSALSGATGLQLWANTPVALVSGLQPFAVADWNGDGVADVLTIVNSAQAVSGASGQTIAAGTDFLAYGVPILRAADSDGGLEFTVQGSEYAARTLQPDLKTAVWVGPNDEPFPIGAIADCATGPQLLEGNLLNPSRVYFTQIAGPSAGMATFSVLAGGKQYTTEAAATADGSYLGQLSDLAIGTNLSGTGKPTAVVGSSDGWLYALDACTGVLRFVVPIGQSVCGAVLGDTDGDGRDEIIVSASDGYLYDVQNDEFPSPAPVLDTDPPLGITDKEISTIVTESTLYGAWQAVPGALNYQIAISHEPDGIVSTPPWQDAGTATSGSITGLPLIVGQKYHFAARAIGPQGASVDAISPGVTVVAGASADAGVEGGATDAGTPVDGGGDGTTGGGPTSSGSGCGCRTASSSGDEAWLPLLGAAVVLVGRRRRRDIEPGTFTRT